MKHSQPNQALEPMETRVSILDMAALASQVSLGLHGSVQRLTLKREGMSSACHGGQRRERRPEASSASSITSTSTVAALPRLVPGGAASDHPRPPRNPRSFPGHGVASFLSKSNQALTQALEPTEAPHIRFGRGFADISCGISSQWLSSAFGGRRGQRLKPTIQTMKTIHVLALATAAGFFLVAGCSTPTSTALAVAATPSTPFTAQYRVGELSGSVTAIAKAGRPVTVFQFETADPAMSCDVSKEQKSAHLTADIIRGGKPVFSAEAPEGTQGVRITHTARGWQQETY